MSWRSRAPAPSVRAYLKDDRRKSANNSLHEVTSLRRSIQGNRREPFNALPWILPTGGTERASFGNGEECMQNHASWQLADLTHNLARVVDRGGAQEVQGRVCGDHRIKVPYLPLNPYDGVRSFAIDREADDFSAVVDGAAATGNRRKRAG